MLHRVLAAVHAVHPNLTLPSRAVVEAILLSKGSIGSAAHVASQLGLGNRFRLARLLKREGLPPLHRLGEWVTVLAWLDSAERDGASLSSIAFHSSRDPSVCYRLVKKLTGRRWEAAQAKGTSWSLKRFLKELRRSKSPSRSPKRP